jgi:hypothetical protein
MKKKYFRILGGLALLTMTLTEFTNCAGDQSTDQPSTVAATDCVNTSCINPSLINVSVTPHLYNGAFLVPSTGIFNIGGDCNEGGYPFNRVHWDLMAGGRSLRNSSQAVMSGASADTNCINGRFVIYINFNPISGDANNYYTAWASIIQTYGTAPSIKISLYAQMTPTDPGALATNGVANVLLVQ